MQNLKFKSIIVFFLGSLICLANISKAQPQKSNFLLSASYDHTQIRTLPSYNSYGITMEGMISNHIGFETSITGGKDNFKAGSAAFSIPITVLYFAYTPKDSKDLFKNFFLKLFVIACVAEHINFHINVAKDFQIIPYTSLFRIRYMYKKNNDANIDPSTVSKENYWFGSWSAGMKLSFINKKNYFLNLYGERTQLYRSDKQWGWQTGLSMGCIFK